MPEWVYLAGMAVNTLGFMVVLFKLIWGGGTGLQNQFHALETKITGQMDTVKSDWVNRFAAMSSNIGDVAQNMSNRIHDIELKAMEFRAIAAETYMRRDSYYKATDEFKKDVRDAHDDLKQEMHAGFNELKDQIGAVSMSIEENRKASVARRGPHAPRPE